MKSLKVCKAPSSNNLTSLDSFSMSSREDLINKTDKQIETMRQILVTVGKQKTDFLSSKTMKYGFMEKYGFGKGSLEVFRFPISNSRTDTWN
jgi:hypothetical protein